MKPGTGNGALQRVLEDPRQNQRALSLASAYAFAGNRDKAMQYLTQAYIDRDPRLQFVRALPQYCFLWGESRIQRASKEDWIAND